MYKRQLTHSLPQEQVFDFITMGVNQSFDAWRRYQRFLLPGVALCDRAACERLDQRYWLADNPEEMLGTYAGPVLIVTGKQDQIVGYEDQQALLPHYPNATFVTLEDVYKRQISANTRMAPPRLDALPPPV